MSLFRRFCRRGLRSLKPLAAPLLNRFQQRLRTAIDYSESAAIIRESSATLGRLHDRLGAIEASLETARANEHRALVKLEVLQLGMDAIRLTVDAVGTRQMTDVATSQQDRAATLATVGLVLQRTDLLLQRAALSVGSEFLVRTPEGFLFAPGEDEGLLVAMYERGGRLEPGTISVMDKILGDGDWVVDVGAHIGTTVLPAAQRVGVAGRVVAVEPGSRVRELLRRSIFLNGLQDRIDLHACAAGEAAGHAELNLGPASSHSSLLALPEAGRTESVEVQPLDALVKPGQPIRLVKLDAEGYEPLVWRGMQRIITESPALAVLVEFGPSHLSRAGISVDDWLVELCAPGFTAYEIDETDGSLRPLREASALQAVFSINLLLLRQPLADFPTLRLA